MRLWNWLFGRGYSAVAESRDVSPPPPPPPPPPSPKYKVGDTIRYITKDKTAHVEQIRAIRTEEKAAYGGAECEFVYYYTQFEYITDTRAVEECLVVEVLS